MCYMARLDSLPHFPLDQFCNPLPELTQVKSKELLSSGKVFFLFHCLKKKTTKLKRKREKRGKRRPKDFKGQTKKENQGSSCETF